MPSLRESGPTAVGLFDRWLSSGVAGAMRPLGFRKAGSTFHLRADGAWGVVSFQKSQWGSAHHVRFYVNLGVALDRLLVDGGRDPAKPPPHFVCNWRDRLVDPAGGAPPVGSWDIADIGDIERVGATVLPLVLASGVPAISARLGEDAFVRTYRDAPRPGWWTPPLSRVLEILGVDAATA